MTNILYFFLGALGIYAAGVGWLYVFQRSMIYFPGPAPGQTMMTPKDAGVAEMRPVRLTTQDGLDLDAWFSDPAGSGRVLVYFHGNAGTIADRADKVRPFLDQGYGVLLVEYRGYGPNPGHPDEAGLYADGDAALRFLDGEGIAPRRWVLYGESLGSAVAVELAAARVRGGLDPVSALVLEAPFTSLVEMAQKLYPFAPASLLVRDRFASIEKIAHVSTPVLMVHGNSDGVVPFALGRKLFAAAKQPKEAIWIMGGGHNNLYTHGAANRILRYLAKLGGT